MDSRGCSVIGFSGYFFLFVLGLFFFCIVVAMYDLCAQCEKYEQCCEKTGLLGLRPVPTQTGMYSHRRWLAA